MRKKTLPDWCEYGSKRTYRVKIARPWHLGWKGSDFVVIVPVGFEFESSVPRGLRWLLSPDDPDFLWAAALHDYLLEKIKGIRRPFADSQWLDAARSDNAPKLKRESAYLGMRARMFFKQFSASKKN